MSSHVDARSQFAECFGNDWIQGTGIVKKVALTGAHGTGKSTLSRATTARLEGKHRIAHTPEVPRLFIEELGDPTRFQRSNNSFGWQTLLLARQIEVESSQKRDTEILICDRTVADHLAYTQILFPAESATEQGVAWKSMAQRWVKTYDLIVRLPIEFQVEIDGVRESDVAFQQEVDRAIQSLYNEFGTKVLTVRGPLTARLESFVPLVVELISH